MKIVVATYGTEGDARPFAALCRGLMDAGHEARLLANSSTLASAHALGVPTTALAGDIRAALAPDGVVAEGGGFNATAKALAKIANENVASWLQTIIEAGQGCDLVLSAGLAAFAGFSAAEYLGVKSVGAGMIPITPTAAFPSPFLAPGLTPRWLNRASHRFVNAMLWRAFRSKTNAARALFKLPPRRKVWDDHPMLYGVSPQLLPAPADWPASARLCGQWLAPRSDWTPPVALAEFLAKGEPPVYVGFGSMAGFDETRLLEALVSATAGRRVLFQAGSGGFDVGALPGNFLAICDTPHDWLFPQVAAAIHHGGSGTSHSAARAATPSIVMPFAGDQFFWAERLRAAGVAPAAVDGKRPSATAIARALDFVAEAPVKRRARALSAAMRAENGAAGAAKALERIVDATSGPAQIHRRE